MPSPNDNLPQELKDKGWDLYEPKRLARPDHKHGETLTKQRINAAAHDVIASRHATLWGRAYGVYEKGGLDDAAKWLTDEVVRVLKELGVAVTDDNFTQGMTEGRVIKHGTQEEKEVKGSPYEGTNPILIEDWCDEDD